MKKILSKAFNINEGEHGRVLLSLLLFLMIMSGIILGRNARDSIFLRNVDIKFLPYMYLLNAVFVVIVSMVYSAVVDKVDRVKFVIVSIGFYGVIAILMRGLFPENMTAFLAIRSAICYVVVQILWLIGLMQFWTFMGDVFDARESKRLFPLISTGGLLGMVVAGVGGKYLVKLIGGTENLFLVWALLMFIGVFLVILLNKKYIKKAASDTKNIPVPAKNEDEKSMVEDFKEGFDYIKSSKLLRTMVFINLAMWIVFTVVDYQFNKVMKQTYPTKDELTAFLGMFRAGAGFVCLVIQLAVTTRLVSFFGIGRTIAIHPFYMVFSTIFLTAKVTFASAFASKFGDHVLLYTIQDSSYQMLYNPVPPDKRGRARAFVEGYIKPISMGIAGLLLILVTVFKATPEIISAIAFAASLAWLFFSLRANTGYVKALTDNLTTEDPHLKATTLSQMAKLSDADNLRVLQGVLKSGDKEMALFALEMIETLKARDVIEDVRNMLTNADPAVRAAAITTLAIFKDNDYIDSIKQALEDPEEEVRRAAVKALGRLNDEDTLPILAPLLADPRISVRAEAVTALISAGGLDGILQAGEILKQMLSSEEAEDRSVAAGVIGAIRVKHFTPTLMKLIDDPDPSVRISAVKAAAKLEDKRTIPTLIEALLSKHIARYAEKGLQKLGVAALPELRAMAMNTSGDTAARKRCVKLIGKIRDRESVDILFEILKIAKPSMRSAAVEALSSYEMQDSIKLAVKPQLDEYIKAEINYVFSLKMASSFYKSRAANKPPEIFVEAIDEFYAMGLERIFGALSLILDRTFVHGIWSKLKSSDPRVKPIALEALDNIGEKELTRRIMPLFEERSPEETIALCRTATGAGAPDEETLYKQFAEDKSTWMRGCVAFALRSVKDDSIRRILDTLIVDEDPFVRETAEWSSKRETA